MENNIEEIEKFWEGNDLVRTALRKAYLAGLDKAKELLPGVKHRTKADNIECISCKAINHTYSRPEGFNEARSLILSRIEVEKGKL